MKDANNEIIKPSHVLSYNGRVLVPTDDSSAFGIKLYTDAIKGTDVIITDILYRYNSEDVCRGSVYSDEVVILDKIDNPEWYI